jgi:formylmethanofuran dehydrogenase subunit E
VAKAEDLKVFIAYNEVTCDECGEELGRRARITLGGDRKAFCLSCVVSIATQPEWKWRIGC